MLKRMMDTSNDVALTILRVMLGDGVLCPRGAENAGLVWGLWFSRHHGIL